MSHAGEQAWPEFDKFYREQFGRVAGAMLLVLGDREEAFDVTQESFARTWIAWERVKRHNWPVAFTFRVATNLSRSHLRRAATFRRLLPRVPRNEDSGAVDAEVENRLAVGDAVRRLPPKQRLAVVLCDLAGLTSEEAARVLRSSASTVRVHLARARAALRAELSSELGSAGAFKEADETPAPAPVNHLGGESDAQ